MAYVKLRISQTKMTSLKISGLLGGSGGLSKWVNDGVKGLGFRVWALRCRVPKP